MKLFLTLAAVVIASTNAAADVENKGRSSFRGLQSGDGSGDTGGGSGGTICFSSENTLDVQGKGAVPIDSVRVGDYVRVAGDKYAPVYSWSHRNEQVEADFVQIQSADHKLELTGSHLVFVQDSDSATVKTTKASDIKVGDIMMDAQGHPTQVLSIGSVKRFGIYAPFTVDGNLIVSGLLASNYATLPFMEHYSFPISFHTMAHAMGAPHRMLCAIHFGWCMNETHNKDSGVSNFAVGFETFQEMAFWQQALVFWMLIPVAFAAFAVEQMFLSALFIHVVVLGCAYAYHHKSQKVSKIAN